MISVHVGFQIKIDRSVGLKCDLLSQKQYQSKGIDISTLRFTRTKTQKIRKRPILSSPGYDHTNILTEKNHIGYVIAKVL